MGAGLPAVFLDRDGVLNRAVVRGGKPYPPGTLEELEILPGVAGACLALREAGLRLVVVTNQPDISRGTQSREAVDALNLEVQRRRQPDDIRLLPHAHNQRLASPQPSPG